MTARRVRTSSDLGMSRDDYARLTAAKGSGLPGEQSGQVRARRGPAGRATRSGSPARTGLGTETGRHLVALDLDGTTLDRQGRLFPEVRAAVLRVARAGHEVVVATGRSSMSTLPVLRALGLEHGYAVCSNGAVTLRLDPAPPKGYHVERSVTFDPAPVLGLLHGAWPGAHVAVEEVGVGFRVNAPFPESELTGAVRVVPWDRLAAGPTPRVTFRSPTATAEDFLELAGRIGLHGVSYAVGYTAWLDITADGVSKASGLEELRGRLGIPAQRTLAVGDQRNDVEMLRWAACGVAMGDAPDPVRAAADRVTGTAEQQGLVPVLDLLGTSS